jgi:hypothetical protein
MLWEGLPRSVREEVRQWAWEEEIPAKPTTLDRLWLHPLSMWWEVDRGKWVRSVLRLHEGPIA